jgi:hypothetical protein
VPRRRGAGQGALRRYAALIGCNDDYYHGPPCGENVSGIAGLSVAANQTYDVVTSPAGALVEGEPALHDGYEDVVFSLELQRGETMKTTIIVTTCALIFAIPLGASELGIQPPPKLPSVVAPSVPDPSRQGGDTIATAFTIPALPYIDTGTTTGYANDYDEVCPFDSMAPDVVYAYTPLSEEIVIIDLCGSAFDTKVYVYDEDMHVVACNDDYYSGEPCGDYRSKIDGVVLAAGRTYYLVVDGYGHEHGVYILDVFVHEPCAVACPAEGVPEGEPQLHDGYVDHYDGGCNTPEHRFFWLLSGLDNGEAVVCGESGWYTTAGTASRDTDWYLLGMGPTGTIEVTAESEMPTYICELLPQDCDDVGIAQRVLVTCGEAATMTLTGYATEGNVWFWVGPTGFEPPIWGENPYDYVLWFEGLDLGVATEATTWSTVKALYD